MSHHFILIFHRAKAQQRSNLSTFFKKPHLHMYLAKTQHLWIQGPDNGSLRQCFREGAPTRRQFGLLTRHLPCSVCNIIIIDIYALTVLAPKPWMFPRYALCTLS